MTKRIDLLAGTFPNIIEHAAQAANANTDIVAKLSGILKESVSVVCELVAAGNHWNIQVYSGKGDRVAWSNIKQLPGCCGVCVSTGAGVWPLHQNKGIGTLLNSYRQELAWQLGYTTLLCTDVDNNIAEQRVLEKTGWKNIFSFNNRRTKNNVSIHVVNLREGRE